MMNIKLELAGSLKKFIKSPDNGSKINLNVENNSKVSDIVNQLNITKEYIALVTVNKKVSDFNSKLKDGDRVVFYPPIAGG